MAEIAYAFACDYLTQDSGGKPVVVGMYLDEVRVQQFPNELRLNVLAVLTNVADDENWTILVQLKSGAEIGRGTLQLKSEKSGRAFLNLPMLNFTLSAPDTITFSVAKDGREPEPFLTLNVDLQQQDAGR